MPIAIDGGMAAVQCNHSDSDRLRVTDSNSLSQQRLDFGQVAVRDAKSQDTALVVNCYP